MDWQEYILNYTQTSVQFDSKVPKITCFKMSRDDIFWCFSQGNGYIANIAVNIKWRMKDGITVRGTKLGQPRASCFRGALERHRPLKEDPCISGGGKTMGADDTLLHPMVPWSLTAFADHCRADAPQARASQLGGKQEMMEGFAMASAAPHLCQAAVSRQGDNSRLSS